ncbi:unnamed protein product, partial [marine sediment metagenome]
MHYPGKIKGKKENLVILTEKVGRTGKAGIGGGADYDFEIT